MSRPAGKRRDRTAPSDAPALRLLAHPKRGAILVEEGTEPAGRRYHGSGLDSDWRQIALFESVVENGYLRPAPTARPPKGFLWGDPERQVHGLSGPILVFGPIERRRLARAGRTELRTLAVLARRLGPRHRARTPPRRRPARRAPAPR